MGLGTPVLPKGCRRAQVSVLSYQVPLPSWTVSAFSTLSFSTVRQINRSQEELPGLMGPSLVLGAALAANRRSEFTWLSLFLNSTLIS